MASDLLALKTGTCLAYSRRAGHQSLPTAILGEAIADDSKAVSIRFGVCQRKEGIAVKGGQWAAKDCDLNQ